MPARSRWEDRVVRGVLASERLPKKLASRRLPAKVAYGSRAILHGFWLGVLSDAHLAALDERYYARENVYRTNEWNEQGLLPWEDEIVTEHFPEGRVAVLACGGGREVLGLRRRGYDAVGYESHPDLVDFAQSFLASHGHPSSVQPADRDEFPSDAGHCAGVIVGWCAYSLVRPGSRRIALTRAIRAHLDSGGPLLLSFFERTDDNRETRLTRSCANVFRRVRGRTPVELGDTLAPNAVHFFSQAELEGEAEAAGFEVVTHRQTSHIGRGVSYAYALLRAR
jgi:hypothetical protein